MIWRLFLLLTLVPLAELALLIWIGTRTSWMVSVAIVIVTALVGALLLRAQGAYTLWRIRAQMAAGRLPADSIADGFLVCIAAALLITPGVITDVAAVALLVPATRRWIKAYARARFWGSTVTFVGSRAGTWRAATGDRPPQDEIIDVQVIEPRRDSN